MKLTKEYLIKLIKEEVNRLDEVTREEVRADFERMFPEETPEQIEARVADYMDYTPEDSYTRRGDKSGPPKKYGLKQGFKDVMKQAFSMEEEKLDPNRPGMKVGETEEEFRAAVRRDAEERAARKKKRKEREDVAAAKRKAVRRAMRRG